MRCSQKKLGRANQRMQRTRDTKMPEQESNLQPREPKSLALPVKLSGNFKVILVIFFKKSRAGYESLTRLSVLGSKNPNYGLTSILNKHEVVFNFADREPWL